MLKRQRASSPVASMPDIPLMSSDSHDLGHQAMKRRRVFAPSLDGPSRGWATPGPSYVNREDEEYLDMSDSPFSPRRSSSSHQTPERPGEYTKFNSILHDLHAETQFRRVMSSSAFLTMPFVADGPKRDTLPPSHHQSSTSLLHPQPVHPGKGIYGLPQSPPTPPYKIDDSSAQFSILKSLYHGNRAGLNLDENALPEHAECDKVKENYEEANKVLRRLFLNRRKHLVEPNPPEEDTQS